MRLQQVLVSDFPFTVSPPHDLPQHTHTHTQMSLTIASDSVIQVLAVLVLNSQFLG